MSITSVTYTYKDLDSLQNGEYMIGQGLAVTVVTDESALTMTVTADPSDPDDFAALIEYDEEPLDQEVADDQGLVNVTYA